MIDWRTLMKAPLPAPQYPQNTQNRKGGGDIEDIEQRDSALIPTATQIMESLARSVSAIHEQPTPLHSDSLTAWRELAALTSGLTADDPRLPVVMTVLNECNEAHLNGDCVAFGQAAARIRSAMVMTAPEALREQKAPPLQPGWLVVYRDRRGTLCGGCDDRAHGTVRACQWQDHGWMVSLTDGQSLPLSTIRSVGQTHESGQLLAAWTVREHGYDGEGT